MIIGFPVVKQNKISIQGMKWSSSYWVWRKSNMLVNKISKLLVKTTYSKLKCKCLFGSFEPERNTDRRDSTELWAAAEHSHSAKYEETQTEDGHDHQVDLAVAHRVGDGHRAPGLLLHVERQREVNLVVCSTSNIVLGFSRDGGNIFRGYWIGLA